MKYEKAIKQLQERGSDRKEPSLEATREALGQLERPDRDYTVILVGGSNGKGSTAEMISELLKHQGFSVGVNKSPHLVTSRERIKVDGELVTEEEFLELYRDINDTDAGLTFFEFMTVAAYLHFSRKEVDYAVMEVGMGGRLDATNAAEPELSVITNVTEEHTRYLGETREEIAREVAGIIPGDGKLVTGEDLEPITDTAEKRSATIVEPENVGKVNGDYFYGGERFSIPVKGSFQQENLENALAAVKQLEKLPELEEALSGLRCPGRMELVSQRPIYIHEGAHNPSALEKIVPELPEDFICVFNCLETKDIERMVSLVEQKASKLYLTQSGFFRAAEPDRIAEHVSIPHEVVKDPEEAVELALEDAGKDGAVVVTGSLYLIGDIKKLRGE